MNFKAKFCNDFTGLNARLSSNYGFDIRINSFIVGKIWFIYLIGERLYVY